MVGQTITHYRIIEEVGRGGMGTVYAAQDTKLGRKVALKVLSEEVASDEERVQRFVREAQAASAINHPNIATIYEIDESEGTTFIAMEFVEGGTLRDRMAVGAMPFREIVEIAAQLSTALGKAHELGIIHRDIKPENICIRPDGLIKILDFGLAKLMPGASGQEEDATVVALTAEGVVMGTARYMSPEQARGKAVDAATDVFSVGAILYEMTTGRPAFPGSNHFEILYSVVNSPPQPIPDELGVPRDFQGVVARALAKTAADRYPDCGALAEDLSQFAGAGTGAGAVPGTTSISPVPDGGAPGAPTGAATHDTVWESATGVVSGPVAAKPGAEQPVTAIVVLPFKNTTRNPDADWMSAGIPEMLTSDLARVATLRVVPSERLAELMTDLKLGPESTFDEPTLKTVGEFLSVDTIVSGSFVKLGPASRIDVSIRRPATGEDVGVKAEAKDEADLLNVISHLTAEVRRAVEAEGARDLVTTMVGERGSQSPGAIRAYIDGLSRLHEGNNIEAINQFNEAIGEDSGFALAYTYLGEALANSGRIQEAKEKVHTALERIGNLSRPDALFVTARDAMMSGEISRAIESLEQLTELLPNNLGAFYELAQAYEREGQWDEALENLERVIELDPKFVGALFALGRVHIKRGSCQEALEFLYRALSLNTLLGNEEGRATVLNAIGLAHFWMDKYDEAVKFYNESLEIKRKIGDRRGESATLSNMAVVFQVKGDYERSVATYKEALEISEDQGDDQGTAENLINIGTVYEEQGLLDDALTSYKRALKLEQDLGDRMAEILCLNDIGNIYLKQAKLDDAEVYFDRALDARRQLGEQKGMAVTLNYLGNIERLRGRYEKAMSRYLEALKITRESGWKNGEAETRGYMAAVMSAQGRYPASHESWSEALRIYDELEDKNGIATTLAGLSKVQCALGHCQNALTSTERALALAREIGNQELVADVLLAMGRVELMRKEGERALEHLAEAREFGERCGGRVTLLMVQSALGRALGESGELEQARTMLKETADEARKLDLGTILARTDLRRAEVLLRMGEHDEALAAVTEAAEAAEAMGEREVMLRAHCLRAELSHASGDGEGSQEQALACLELAAGLSGEMGDSSESFLSRPTISGAVAASCDILEACGRGEDVERFGVLRGGSCGGGGTTDGEAGDEGDETPSE
jgi:tetratricopeptide (TPR) repeat protein/tRNA A-37 threonylcarbamoyl transferase component Bud32